MGRNLTGCKIVTSSTIFCFVFRIPKQTQMNDMWPSTIFCFVFRIPKQTQMNDMWPFGPLISLKIKKTSMTEYIESTTESDL